MNISNAQKKLIKYISVNYFFKKISKQGFLQNYFKLLLKQNII